MNTTDVFLECAYFDPTRTAVTGRMHQVITDARYRFERGIDPQFTSYGIDLATQMILDLCGGEASEIVEAGAPIVWDKSFQFNTAQTEKLTGVKIDVQEQLYILGSLGFEVDGDENPYTVHAPTWRPDIMGTADLVEEIIRVYGYDKINATPVQNDKVLTENALSPIHSLRMNAGRTLGVRGMQECITWSFMPYDLAKSFNNEEFVKPSLKLTNPLSVEMDTMRPSILPNLIQACARNADRGYPNASLFEVGPTFHGVEADEQPIVCAGVRHGVQANKHWSSSNASRQFDAYDAKSDALAVIQSINPSLKPQIDTNGAPSHFHPGRSGVFRLGKNILATFGEIHPSIIEDIDIIAPVVGFEVFLQNIPTAKKGASSKGAIKLNALQPINRDFAFVVDDAVTADSITGAALKGGGKMVSDVRIFDVYQGKGVPEGQKSIAISMQFTPTDKTLTDKEIEELSTSVINQVTSKTGATLRG